MEANNGTEKTDFSKKRQQHTRQIRRQNRQEIISKRRNIQTQSGFQSSHHNDDHLTKITYMIDKRYQQLITKFQRVRFQIHDLNDLVKALQENNIQRQHYGAIGIRKIMSLQNQPPIQIIVDFGVVPRLIQLVNQQQYPQLQLQATWSLANVASGTSDQCRSIIDKGAINIFIRLLKSPHLGIVQQAIWALGNIASDSSFHRDAIIRNGGVPTLMYVLQTTTCPQLIQPGAWTLSNLCRGTPLPNSERVKEGVMVLADLITKNKIKDQTTFSDCCWSISFHFPRQKAEYQKLLTKQLIYQMVEKLKKQDPAIIVPVIRIVGHITKISNYYVDIVLQQREIVDSFYELLCFQKKTVRMQTLWVISNIMSGPQRHIDALLQNQHLMAKILELFEVDSQQIKRQICCVFANMTIQSNPLSVFTFFKNINILKFYVQALASQNPRLIIDSLDNMYPILELGQKFKQNGQQNPFVADLLNMGALNYIEQLQFHDEQGVYESVVKLMKRFFEMEDNLNF